ncbi:RING-H2 finger protein ATL80 [Morus notabilis]|uniref:RING-H2 finger protein ATL80 n=1 Tax=Morus notabilis TaxID=981085 RepID=UPI000CED3791|nr:RING-H2 finger protein ATL80 [Morus notabilis]
MTIRTFRLLGGVKSPSSTTVTAGSASSPLPEIDVSFIGVLFTDVFYALIALLCLTVLLVVCSCLFECLKMMLMKKSSSTADVDPSFAAANCTICLFEFAEGDEIRELRQCGHAFHVTCINTWLRWHSSCPTCAHMIQGRDHIINRFLPLYT